MSVSSDSAGSGVAVVRGCRAKLSLASNVHKEREKARKREGGRENEREREREREREIIIFILGLHQA